MREMLNEKQIVQEFLKLGSVSRIQALLSVLHGMGFKYRLESCSFHFDPQQCTNVIIDVNEVKPNEKYTLFVAHYDLWGNSTGINDNTVSIATLLMFLKDLKHRSLSKPIKILFTDREETGMVGSSNYAERHKDEIEQVIVLDIVGYGERLAYGSNQSDYFKYLKMYDIAHISKVLPSDNITFSARGINSVLITAIHRKDLIYNKDRHNYDITASPKFYDSFHERVDDNKLDVINWKLVKSLRERLFEIVK
jgi:hypothetical protein